MAMNRAMKRPVRLVTLLTIVLATIIARALRTSGASTFPALITGLLVVAGLGLLIGTAYHTSIWLSSKGAQRKAQGMLLLTYLGLIVAAILYLLTTPTGMGWLGVGRPRQRIEWRVFDAQWGDLARYGGPALACFGAIVSFIEFGA